MIDLRPAMDPVSAVILCRPGEATDYGTITFHGATEAVTAAAFGAATTARTDVSAQAFEGEYLPDPIEGNLIIRLQTLPSVTADIVAKLRESVLAAGGTITILPLTGRIGFSWPVVPDNAAELIDSVATCSASFGASWFIDEAPIELRSAAWCGPPATDSAIHLNAGIRSAFDPDGRLNSGRFAPGS
jgi:hypothetical protein